MKSKLKKNNGSGFILAIIVIAIVSMMTFIVFGQINNQIKFNLNRKEYMAARYYAEAGVEKTIYDATELIKEAIINPNVSLYNARQTTFTGNNDNINNYLNKAIDKLNSVEFKDSQAETLRMQLVSNIRNAINNCTIEKTLEFRQSCLDIITRETDTSKLNVIYEVKRIIYLAANEIYLNSHTGHKPARMDSNGIYEFANNGAMGEIDQITKNQGRLWNSFDNLIKNGGINQSDKTVVQSTTNYIIESLRGIFNQLKPKLVDTSDKSSLINIVKSVQIDQNTPADINNTEIQKFIISFNDDLNDAINLVIDMQLIVDKMYVENSNKSGTGIFLDVTKQLNSIKNQLYEIKCKLGIKNSNSDGENNSEPIERDQRIKINQVVIPAYNYPNNYSEINNDYTSNINEKAYFYKRNQINFDIYAICDIYENNQYHIKSILPIDIEGDTGIKVTGTEYERIVELNPDITIYPNVDGSSSYAVNEWK